MLSFVNNLPLQFVDLVIIYKADWKKSAFFVRKAKKQEEIRHIMKKIRFAAAFLLTMALTLLAGCGKKDTISGSFVGEWGYIHEPEVSALVLEADGDAVLDNVKYTYRSEDGKLVLTAKDGGAVTNMKYVADGDDGMYIYKTARYNYSGDGNAEGIIGVWNNDSSSMSFEFTGEGTFKEDGYFPGYYFEDTANHTIKLVYNDHFEDTVIYYSVDNNVLTVEYPWKMVRIK